MDWLVLAGEEQSIFYGGTASKCKIQGSQYVEGKAIDCLVIGGDQSVTGLASNTHVLGNGYDAAGQHLYGADVYKTIIGNGATQVIEAATDYSYVYDDVILDGGKIYVAPKYVGSYNIDYSYGARFYDTIVNSGGTVYIRKDCAWTQFSGVTYIAGEMYFIDAGISNSSRDDWTTDRKIFNDGVIVFGVDKRSLRDTYIISNLNNISGGNYAISIEDDMAAGSYKLAKNAYLTTGVSIFDIDTSETIGTLYVNGQGVLYKGENYTLKQSNGLLTLSVSNISMADLQIVSSKLSRISSEAIRFDPSESFTYSFTVKNSGDLDAAASTAYLYVDGEKYAEIATSALAAGASKEYTYNFNAGSLKNGSHTIHVAVDSKGIINEDSESNNTSSEKEFIIEPAMADLAIRNFTAYDVNGNDLLVADQNIIFSAQIENRSANKSSAETTAALYLGDKLLGTFAVPSIEPGNTFDLSYTLVAGSCSAGKVDFKLVVDHQNNCTEFNENNNSKVISKQVNDSIKPDLQVKKITVLKSEDGSQPCSDEEIEVTIEIENFIDGDIVLGRSSVATDVALFCNGMKLTTLGVPMIAAGKTHSVTCTIPQGLLPQGENSFYAELDTQDKCSENNEENNSKTLEKYLSYTGPELSVSEIRVNGVRYEEGCGSNTQWIKSEVDNDISFTVVNNGNQSSQETIVRIMLDPYHDQNISQWRDIKIDALAPGASKNYTISTTAEEITMGQIVFEIDPYNTSHDKDLSDNSISSKTIYVREPDLYGSLGFLTGIVDFNKWQNFDTSMYLTTDGESLDISYGETLYVACNRTIPTGTYPIKLYCDDTLIKSWNGKYYTGDRWQFFEFSTSSLPVGHHKLRISCGPSPTGTTYNNYGWEKRYWVTIDAVIEQSTPELTWEEPKSDLTITAAKLRYPDDLKNAHEITFTVKNEGSCEAYKASHGNIACLYAGEKEIAKYFLPVIYAGEEKEFTFTLADDLLPEGENELKLQVQYYTPEWDKNPNNNTFEFLADIPVKKKSKIEISVAETKKSNNTVMIEADFSSSLSLVSKQYSVGLEEWKDYIQPIIVNKNSVVHFRAVDELGASSVKAHDVNNLITITPHNSQISAYSLSWAKTSDDASCIVEISLNAFQQVLQLKTSAPQIDFLNLSEKNYQWIVKFDGEKQAVSGNIASQKRDDTPQKIVAVADGNMDVFFANANGVWENGYAAQHQGSGSWQGTRESIVLSGKNKIADVFTGSSDANVLVLTDDANGDALFIDDIYTQFGSDASRLAQINEIRAGAGNDIVDLTSQQFAYIGSGATIYGGAGDDVIWANSGNNTLFGDAGNDRLVGANGNDIIIGGAGNDSMHGGGGNDTFCFGANFGNDTVEQLSGGSVTLYFETGSDANWNQDTLTYTDGANSVKVSGVTDVTLVFGGTSPVEGVFLDAASEKIFEDKNKGMIA